MSAVLFSVLAVHPCWAAADRCLPPPSFHLGHNSAEEYSRLGDVFAGQRRFSCAAEEFQHATELSPTTAAYQYALGVALYSGGRAEASRVALERAVQLDSTAVKAHLALGAVDHDLGRGTAALQQWEEALRLDPGSVTALDWIAKSRLEASQYTAAIDLLRTAPEEESLALDLMVAYSRAGMPDMAITQAQRARGAHPDWTRLSSALAVILTQRNRFQEASAVLEQALAQHREDRDLKVAYLRVLVLAGALAKAMPLVESYRSHNPEDFDALYLSGLLHREDGEYEAAERDLRAAAARQPDSYDVRLNLGTVLAKLHRPAEAREELERAAVLNGTPPEVHFQLAGVMRTMGDSGGAQQQMELYQQGLRQRAKHDETVSLTAQAAAKLAAGDAAGAAAAYREIVAGDPGNAIAFYNLALALDRMSDPAGEEAALQAAVRLRPDLAVAQNQLGYLNANAGKAGPAEAYFREAIASAPQFAEAESNLGSLLAGEGHEAEAEQLFRDALAANPRYTDAWINLAATLAGRSRYNEARDAARNALRIEPDSKAAAELLAALAAERAGVP